MSKGILATVKASSAVLTSSTRNRQKRQSPLPQRAGVGGVPAPSGGHSGNYTYWKCLLVYEKCLSPPYPKSKAIPLLLPSPWLLKLALTMRASGWWLLLFFRKKIIFFVGPTRKEPRLLEALISLKFIPLLVASPNQFPKSGHPVGNIRL